MPKQKTHKGTKKRFRLTASGKAKLRFKTIFISDVHLGTPGCKADLLIEFLRRYEAEIIYLVGDIIDGWRLKGGWYLPQVQSILCKVAGQCCPSWRCWRHC